MQTETATSAWGYTLLRCMKRRGNLLPSFVNLRKQILAVGSHRPHLYFPISYIWETATSAWGYTLLRCAETTRQLVAVVRICVSKFCRRLPSPALILSYQLHMGNGNFRMGLRTSSLRETTRQLVCRRSSICASKFLPRNSVLRRSKVSERACKRKRQLPHGATYFFVARKRRGNLFAVVRQFAQANSCRRLPSPALLLSCQLHMGNGNFRMGLHTSSVRGNDAATSFLYDKRFFRLNTI